MRYSSALVLGALAAGQATAHNARHASFHARRHVDAKRDLSDVDWSKVSYDLSGISDSEWSSILASPSATPVAAAPSSAAAAATTAAVEAAAVTTKAAATSTSEKAAATSAASGSDSSNAVSNILSGVESFVTKLGTKMGVNDESDNGKAWIGSDSSWKMNMNNAGSDSIYVFCWSAADAWINVAQPLISIHLGAGDSQTVSFAQGFSGACASAGDGISLVDGLISNTWLEATFAETYGVFDVSREVNGSGSSISAVGSQCTSDMNTCVFKCGDGSNTCLTGYVLDNCGASNGGGSGTDTTGNGGASGGCMMGATSESIDVTFG